MEQEHHEIDEGIERFAADPSSAEARQALTGAIAALRRHIYLEEELMFPALQGGGVAGLVAPIFVMLREHAQLWHTMDELALVAGAGMEDAPKICNELLVQLQHHNMKEERILYPEADRTLPLAVAGQLAEFLASGEMPAGWVCVKARD